MQIKQLIEFLIKVGYLKNNISNQYFIKVLIRMLPLRQFVQMQRLCSLNNTCVRVLSCRPAHLLKSIPLYLNPLRWKTQTHIVLFHQSKQRAQTNWFLVRKPAFDQFPALIYEANNSLWQIYQIVAVMVHKLEIWEASVDFCEVKLMCI